MEGKFEHFKLVFLDYLYRFLAPIIGIVILLLIGVIYVTYNLNKMQKINQTNSINYPNVLSVENIWGLSPYHKLMHAFKSAENKEYFIQNKDKCASLGLNSLIESVHGMKEPKTPLEHQIYFMRTGKIVPGLKKTELMDLILQGAE